MNPAAEDVVASRVLGRGEGGDRLHALLLCAFVSLLSPALLLWGTQCRTCASSS
jgi:hypothetical protein